MENYRNVIEKLKQVFETDGIPVHSIIFRSEDKEVFVEFYPESVFTDGTRPAYTNVRVESTERYRF